MIEIDGVELRTAAQWEKKHRHVKKGQLGKGVERTWRSPNGNTTAMFYNIEQTRPWAKKDVEAVNRRRHGIPNCVWPCKGAALDPLGRSPRDPPALLIRGVAH